MNENLLEKIYQERLEERIIRRIAEIKKVSLEQAMDIYYSNKLSKDINRGVFGVQYMDYKILADLICGK